MKLPFRLIFGKIGKLSLTIPWKQNFSVPTVINLDTIQIVLQIVKKEDWQFIDYNSFENKIYYLLKFANERIYQLSQALANKNNNSTDTSGGSYIDRVMMKVLDNLHVNFKNINIRIEDNENKISRYSLGLTLQEMFVVNTNEKWEQEFIDRNVNKNINVYKLLKISNFGIYLHTGEEYFISAFKYDEIANKMSELFPSGKEKVEGMDYLIKPISLTAKMKQINNNENLPQGTARINLFIDLDDFNFHIQKMQFDCLIRIINDVSDYQKIQYDFNNTIKYKIFRPKYKLSMITEKKEEEENKITIFSSLDSNKKQIAYLWWQYSIRMVIKQLKFSKGNLTIFSPSQSLLQSNQNQFSSLFKKYYKDQEKGLNEEELNDFKYILEVTELKDLFIWSKPVLQEVFKDQKKEEKKGAQNGYFYSFFGRSINENDLITKEEEEKIEEILSTAVKEATSLIINNETETKLQVFFTLNEGSFKFSKFINASNANITEGFGLRYRKLTFCFKKGEYFFELDSELKEFQVEMFTIINKNIISIPITFKQLNDNVKINNPVVNVSNKDVEKGIEITKSSFENINTINSVPSNHLSSSNVSSDDDYFLKLKFIKNNPNEEINSKFSLNINVLHFTYHQVFFERIITFFRVNLDEDLANAAWEKINNIKANTQQTIKENMHKTNIIEMHIEPRKVIIPINKYDIKTTKILLLDLGRLTMINEEQKSFTDDKYKERYCMNLGSLSVSFYPSFRDMIHNNNQFKIISDVNGNISFAVLSTNYSPEEFPSVMLFLEITNINIDLNCYLYTLLIYVIDILKPTKEVDLWSQLNSSKEEIKKNARVLSKVCKKNSIYLNYEEFFAVLASGYIYFYNSSDDDEYVGYYYLKDTQIDYSSSDPLVMKLSNIYGSVELKFPNEGKFQQWKKAITERITEMKVSSYDKEKEIDIENKKNKINPNLIYFGIDIVLRTIKCNLYQDANESVLIEENNPMFTIDITLLKTEGEFREYESEFKLSIGGVRLYDNKTDIEDFKLVISSEDEDSINTRESIQQSKLVELSILICDENAKRYNNTQINININIGTLFCIWDPIVIRRLLGFLVHNNITKHKINREISNQNEKLLDSNFLEPGKEEVIEKPKCTVQTYTYIYLHTQFKEVRIVLIQPKLRIKYNELRFGASFLDCDMKVDHFLLKGELGNTQLFDLSQYPFVINSQKEYDKSKIKEIFGIKQNTESLISFDYKSMYTWCPECKDNYLSEANVKINSAFLIYFHEHFMRFFNYFISEFLGALAPSEEVQNFMNNQYKIEPKNEKDIYFLKLNLSITNPQIILKPRPSIKEYFCIDLGTVNLKCNYQIVYGKNRNDPKDYRWVTTYQFDLDKASITTEDDFNILSPTNCIVNMHFVNYTEKDILLSPIEFDFSYQFDIYVGDFNMNLRQRDYRNFMRCLDLNVLYTDEKEEDYNYAPVKSTPTSSQIKLKDNKEELMKKYLSLIAYVLLGKITLRLYLEDNDHIKPFCELILKETQVVFTKNLVFNKDVRITIADMGMFDLSSSTRENILSDFSKNVYEFVNNDISPLESKDIAQSQIERAKVSNKNIINKIIPKISSNDFIQNTSKYINECKIIDINTILEEGSKIQSDITISIDAEREKTYIVKLYGFKLLIRLDTFQLCRYFFMEGFPYYAKNQKDLPNLYDPNEENNPGTKFLVDIKHGLICFLTDSLSNKQQELICIASDVTCGMKNEKISKIKQELISRYKELTHLLELIKDKAQEEKLKDEILNDKGITWEFKLNLFDICPFMCNYEEINGDNDIIIGKRKIMDNFDFMYESKTQMQYLNDCNNYMLLNVEKINLSKITVKASYRDIVLYLKMSEFYRGLQDETYAKEVDSLMTYSKAKKKFEEDPQSRTSISSVEDDKSISSQNTDSKSQKEHSKPKAIIDTGMNSRIFNSEGFQLILIDDHANTFYPFLSLSILEFVYKCENINRNKSNTTSTIIFKALSYNYIAGYWEPLIEKTSISLESMADTSNPEIYKISYDINTSAMKTNSPDININISDLSIVFLSGILSKWMDKYFLLKNNYTSEIVKIQSEKNMNITNHTLFNYSGRILTVYRKINNGKKEKEQRLKLGEVKQNEEFDIEYFEERNSKEKKRKDLASNLLNENYIIFKLQDAPVSNREIKIDNMQTKIHMVDYTKIMSSPMQSNSITANKDDLKKYNYIISKIEFHKLKKFIYFYSPLNFKNKTQFTFPITIRNNPYPELSFVLSPKSTIGIPYEYLNGSIVLTSESEDNQNVFNFKLKDFLLTKRSIIEEIKIDSEKYINLYHPSVPQESSFYIYKMIKIRISYTLRNCLPFDIQIIVNGSKQFINIKKNESVDLPNISIYKNLYIKVFFYSFKTKNDVRIYNIQEPQRHVPIQVTDDLNNPLNIFATLINDSNGREIAIHANTVIINHTGLNIYFTCGDEESKITTPLANQRNHNNFFLLNDEKFIVLSFNGFKSKPVAINAIGTSSTITLVNKKSKQKIEIIMEISLSLVAIDLDIYTNMITLVPRYIIYNLLDGYKFNVILEKGNSSKDLLLLKEGEKKQLYYTNYISEKEKEDDEANSTELLRFVPQDNSGENIWEKSTPYITSYGALTTLISRTKDKRKKLYFNIEKQIDNLSTYLIIKQATYKTSQIIIENYSSYISFCVWQEGYFANKEKINIKSKSMYAWSNMNANNFLNFQFYIGDINNNPVFYPDSSKKFEILDDKVAYVEKDYQTYQKYPLETIIKINKTRYSGVEFKFGIDFDGSKTVITMRDITEDISEVKDSSITTVTECNIHINKLGLSLICDNQHIRQKNEMYERNEICYITIDDIILYSRNELKDNINNNEFQVVFKDVEIDNEIAYVTNFPIVFLAEESPRKEKKKKENEKVNNNPFFNCAIFMTKKPDEAITRITLMNYLIQAFELNIESNVLIGFLNFVKNTTIGMQTSVTQVNPIFLSDEYQAKNNINIKDWKYTPLWIDKEIKNENKQNLLIAQLVSSSLEFTLTFISQTKDKVFHQFLQNNKVLSSLSNVISNIEKVPLFLNGCQMVNLKGDWYDLLGNIFYVYKQQLLVQVMKLFGSIDFIGNPVNLMNSLGRGFKDLFQKPAEGIMNGPLQGAIGLMDGGISLAKHTVDGTFNTTSKITGGISKGMLLITQDDEYINDREKKKITERPGNFIEGIGFGLSSMANGLFSGVTDIVAKPIEGAKEDNIKGFGKGLIKGVSGLIFKPISGVFDLISKTTEGIKNTVNTDKALKGIRLPRVFYGKFKLIKGYNESDALVYEMLSTKIEQVKGTKFDFYSSEVYKNHKEENILMVFYTEGFHIIDLLRREIKIYLPYLDIRDVKMENRQKIKLIFTRKINERDHTSIMLSKNEKKGKQIYEKIKDAINTNCEARNLK